MNKKDFVIVSVSPWDFEYGSNIKDISLELSTKHRVLFVNIPLKITELISGKLKWIEQRRQVIKSFSNNYEKVNKNLHVLTTPIVFFPVNQIKNRFIFNLFNAINNKLYSWALNRAILNLKFSDVILLNDNDFSSSQNLPKLINAKTSAYYLRDKFSAMTYWQKIASHAEPKTIKNYGITLSNSVYLANFAKQYQEKSYYVGQGCDVTHFSSAPQKLDIPDDLKIIPGPLIGYIGALNAERLDIDLIGHIAKINNDKSIVLIGPEDGAFINSYLHSIPNIHFLGSKDFTQLLNYMWHLDVCINPQGINDITIGNYPRKIDEYLAVGKPVVATYTETMVPFESVCYLAKNNEEYIELINVALQEDSLKLQIDRKKFAESHTWENSVSEMLKNLEV